MENEKMITVPAYLVSEIIDNLYAMINYADDGNIDREDEDYTEFFEDVDNATQNADALWNIYKEQTRK